MWVVCVGSQGTKGVIEASIVGTAADTVGGAWIAWAVARGWSSIRKEAQLRTVGSGDKQKAPDRDLLAHGELP